MRTIYRGFTQRVQRTFYDDNAATDLDALTVTIKKEDGTVLETSTEGSFEDLNILANNAGTGIYFIEITPDAAESLGIYVVYWRATYGTGDTAETFPHEDVLAIRAEDEAPDLPDNYVSLDKINEIYPKLFDLKKSGEILRIGSLCSRVLDSELDQRFDVPIRKRADTGAYDDVLVTAATLLAIARILKPEGYTEEAEDKLAEYAELVDGLNRGRWRLWEEITADEIGFGTPRPATTNAGTEIELELDKTAAFSGLYHRLFVIEVDGAGDIYDVDTETGATVKISKDGGKTWDAEDQPAKDTWIAAGDVEGLAFRFFRRSASGNLALGDKWEIEAWPTGTPATPGAGQIQTGKALI